MTGSRDRDLLSRIERLEQEMYGVDRKSGVKAKVEEVWSLSKMGRGALWMLIKIGTVAGAIVGLAVAAWRYFFGGP